MRIDKQIYFLVNENIRQELFNTGRKIEHPA